MVVVSVSRITAIDEWWTRLTKVISLCYRTRNRRRRPITFDSDRDVLDAGFTDLGPTHCVEMVVDPETPDSNHAGSRSYWDAAVQRADLETFEEPAALRFDDSGDLLNDFFS